MDVARGEKQAHDQEPKANELLDENVTGDESEERWLEQRRSWRPDESSTPESPKAAESVPQHPGEKPDRHA